MSASDMPAVHAVPGSPYGRVVQIALEEKGVAYSFKSMQFGDNRQPEYLALQPFGRIPVLIHGDFALYETQAILRYVDRAFEGPPLQPSDARALGRMDQVMNIIDWYLFPTGTAGIAFERIVAPVMLGRAADETKVAASVPGTRQAVAALATILDDKPFLTGDSLSLADIMLVTHIEYLAMTPEGAEMLGGGFLDWLGRMQARDSLKATRSQFQQQQAA